MRMISEDGYWESLMLKDNVERFHNRVSHQATHMMRLSPYCKLFSDDSSRVEAHKLMIALMGRYYDHDSPKDF